MSASMEQTRTVLTAPDEDGMDCGIGADVQVIKSTSRAVAFALKRRNLPLRVSDVKCI